MFEAGDMRGAVVDLDGTWREVLARRTYPLPVRTLLGEAMAASALLSSTLKFDGTMVLQAQAEDPEAPVRVLVVSMYPEDQYALRALKAGAAGYLTKESATEDLVNAIRKVARGGRFVSAALGERLAQELAGGGDQPLHQRLSDREYQIMWLIASGKTAGEIAEQLFLSPNTISTYRARILQKLDLKNNAELMRYAIHHQLIE
jgi:DNA-binding NarL/FixJ family response regulator